MEYTNFWWWVTAIIVGVLSNFIFLALRKSYNKNLVERTKRINELEQEREKNIIDLIPHPEIMKIRLLRLILNTLIFFIIIIVSYYYFSSFKWQKQEGDSDFIVIIKVSFDMFLFFIIFLTSLKTIKLYHEHFTITMRAIDRYIRQKYNSNY